MCCAPKAADLSAEFPSHSEIIFSYLCICLQAPAGVLLQSPVELLYAAPFIPPPSLPPPEYTHQDAAMPFQPIRKKAIVVGCNYTSIPQAALKGCVRDALCLSQLLIAHYR